jgi:hypothetical protein
MGKSGAILFFVAFLICGLAIALGNHAIIEIRKAGIPPFHQSGDGMCTLFLAGPLPPRWLMSAWSGSVRFLWLGFVVTFLGGGSLLLARRAVRLGWAWLIIWTTVVTTAGLWLGLFLVANLGFPD